MAQRVTRSWQTGSAGAALCLAIACGSKATSPPTGNDGGSGAGNGGGLNLNLPPPSCPDPATTMRDAGSCVPLQTRNFTTEIAPLFNGCAGEVCHNFAGGAIASLISVPEPECCNQLPVIDPGHPETSYLLRKLSGTNLCAGAQMPLEREPLAAADQQAISDWICAGAKTP